MFNSPLNISPLSLKRSGNGATVTLTTASTASANIRIDTKSGGTFKVDWGQGSPTITASNLYENKTYSPNYSGDVIVYNRNDIDSFYTTDGAWNFDVALLPKSMTGTFGVSGNSIAVTGDIANTSQLLTGTFGFEGSSLMTLTGDIANTSQLLTGTFYLVGNSMTITGDIANTSQLLTGILRIVGNSMTITGDLANTSQLLTGSLVFVGNLITTYGDIAVVASGITILHLNTPLGEYTYTAGRVWANMTEVFIRPKAGFITSTEVDNIFIDIDNSPLAVAGGTIDLRGNCGAVTAASSAARSSLAGKGYTCLFNGPISLILTQKHEFLFDNVQNASADIITIPDTGTVGGLDLSNSALANKPTASTIGGKISYAADGVDDYLYKSTTNFMKSMTTWMVTVVFRHDGSDTQFLAAHNETNTNVEGWVFRINSTLALIRMGAWDATGVETGYDVPFSFVNGQDYIITVCYDGAQIYYFEQTNNLGGTSISNIITIPTQTDNVTFFARIRPNAGNFFRSGNIAYIGVDEFDLTRLNNNVATLKSYYGI